VKEFGEESEEGNNKKQEKKTKIGKQEKNEGTEKM
jgi:hypothetical protein